MILDTAHRYGAGNASNVMCDQLVAYQVPVDPVLGASTFVQSDDLPVQPPGGCEVIDGDGEVNRWTQWRVVGARSHTLQLPWLDAVGSECRHLLTCTVLGGE